MFYQLSLISILAIHSSAFQLDLDFMTSDDLERYFSVREIADVPEYEIVDPLAYSAGGRNRRSIEFGESTKEIKLSAFGEELHMKLDENTQLLADGLQVDVHNEDGTVDKIPLTTTRCFYHGQLMSHENSKVAVSTCDGLTGMIATETHDLFIRPLTEEHKEKYRRRRRDVANPHVIYRRETNQQDNVEPPSAFCAMDPEYPEASHMLHETMETIHQMQAVLAAPAQEYVEGINMTPLDDDDADTDDDDDEEEEEEEEEEEDTVSYQFEATEPTETYEDEITVDMTTSSDSTTESPELYVTEGTDEDEDDEKGRRGGDVGRGHGSSGASSRGGDSDGGSSRKKRQTNVLYLEVRVMADVDMVNYHGQSGVVPYVLNLMNIVAARYVESSLGRTIIIHIVKLGYLNSDSTSDETANGRYVPLTVNKDGVQTLNSWSYFQYYTNPFTDNAPDHYDNAVLITRKNLEIDGSNSLLGIAWGNATCYLPRQASVNQDQGLSSGIVISHEIGHTLGMDHDSDNGCRNGINVMSSHRPNGAGSFTWSSCSRADLNTFLSDPYKQCLNDQPTGVSQHPLDADNRPGIAISADEQCRLQSTDVQTYVGSCTTNLANICANLFCQSSSGYCSGIVAAAEGTTCGSGKWCISGQCVTRTGSSPSTPTTPTTEWRVTDGTCSVTCGNGVSKQVVRCFSPSQNTYVDEQQCNAATRPTPTQISCIGPTCPTTFQWLAQEGSCSVSCGSGVKVQVIWCYSQTSHSFVDDVFCDQASRPTPVSQPCSLATCPEVNNNWSSVPGPCSTSCGTGTKTDVVYCLSPSGQTLPDNQCDAASKPTPTTSSCFEIVCPTFWLPRSYEPCSVTCGTGNQIRDVWCVISAGQNWVRMSDDQCDQLTKPPTTQQCGSPNTCPDNSVNVWVIASFSECSATCGDGTRTRSVTCRSSQTSTLILTDSQCQQRKPETSEVCNIHDCPEVIRYTWYEREEFGECSVTCGSGTQSTLLLCVDLVALTTVYISFCDVNTRPQQSTRECHAGVPCSSDGIWQAGGFSLCSATCGQGNQQRLVICTSPDTNVRVSESDCDHSTKPDTTQTCNAGACPLNSEWATTDFSSCSVTCGQGTQIRGVYCRSTTTQFPVSESECNPNIKPIATQICYNGQCIIVEWAYNSFSPCSVSCGEGVQTRRVYCRSTTTSSLISESACDAITKPSSTQTCYNGQCQSGQWAYTSWSGCSVSCGQGSQSRQVYCYSLVSNTALPESECNPNDRPATSGTCNSGACPNNGPDQGVHCAGLWTRSDFNLNRISSSTNGALCKESIVAQPGQKVQITFNRCYLIPDQGDRGFVRDADDLLPFSCTDNLDDETGQPYVWTSDSHLVQLEHIGAANHGYDVTVEFIGHPENDGCDIVLTAESGTVTSPNYPAFYPSNLRCQTVIIAPPNKRVKLAYEDIRLHPSFGCFDRLEVYDVDSGDGIRYCGTPSNVPNLRHPAHDNRVLIQFISNNDNGSSNGFRITYTLENV